MKTKPLSNPVPPLLEGGGELSLKAYFCGCALTGSIANQEEDCPTHSDEDWSLAPTA
jgi:hypothetical protein